MKKSQSLVVLIVAGFITGVVIAEFFPRLFQSGLMGSLNNAFSEPFSRYRNDLAVKYGLFGAVIGAAAGIVIMALSGKKR